VINFKNILILTLASLSLATNAFAQKKRKNAISINLTSPLIQAINKNKTDSTSLRIPTNIALSHAFNNWLIRIGAGGYNNYQTLGSDIYVDRKIENIYKLSALLSAYHLTTISDKWLFGIGPSVSGVYNKTEKVVDSGNDIINSYSNASGWGIGGGALFQYNINDRLSLFSEYNVLYNVYETSEGKEFSAIPSQNYARNKITNQGIQFQFPLALYINYNF
jgi:hypothetical protein